jgi:hypothetical protein
LKTATLHTINGETHTMAEWAKITGLSYYAVRRRFAEGKPLIKPKVRVKYPCSTCEKRCLTHCALWLAWFRQKWQDIQAAADIIRKQRNEKETIR